jgi:hypothetical protein
MLASSLTTEISEAADRIFIGLQLFFWSLPKLIKTKRLGN